MSLQQDSSEAKEMDAATIFRGMSIKKSVLYIRFSSTMQVHIHFSSRTQVQYAFIWTRMPPDSFCNSWYRKHVLHHTKFMSCRYVRMKADKDIFIIMQLIQVIIRPSADRDSWLLYTNPSVCNDGAVVWRVSDTKSADGAKIPIQSPLRQDSFKGACKFERANLFECRNRQGAGSTSSIRATATPTSRSFALTS